jgi:hypothetical protein
VQLLNQYSYLVVAMLVLAGTAAAALHWLNPQGSLIVVVLTAVALLAVYRLLRHDQQEVPTAADLETVLGAGTPVLLELYSNY